VLRREKDEDTTEWQVAASAHGHCQTIRVNIILTLGVQLSLEFKAFNAGCAEFDTSSSMNTLDLSMVHLLPTSVEFKVLEASIS
jgi:hypothetical protein